MKSPFVIYHLSFVIAASLLLAACECPCHDNDKPTSANSTRHPLGDSGVTVSGQIQSGTSTTTR